MVSDLDVSAQSSMTLFARILTHAKAYWVHLVATLLLSLLSVPLALLTPLPLKIAVDNVIGSRPLPSWLAAFVPSVLQQSGEGLLVFAAVFTVLVVMVRQSQALASWLLQAYLGQKLTLDFRARLFHHLQRLSLSYHDTAGSSDSTYRIQYDATAIQHIAVNGVIPLVTSAATLAGMIWVTAAMDLTLAAVALGVTPVLYVLTASFGERLRGNWKDAKRLDSTAMAVVQEVLSSLRVVKAFGAEDREQRRFLDQSSAALQRQIRVSLTQGSFDLLVAVTIAIGSALGLYVGVRHVQSGSLTVGQLLMVMAYLAMLYEPLRELSKKIADLQAGFASAERAFALLDRQAEVAERPDAQALGRAKGAIAFDHVEFAYAGGHPVLHDVCFEVPAGSRVGIQGATGAGKTTLMSLLMRFYDPTVGRILIDGVDLRAYRVRDLRQQFAIVLQEPVLFSASFAENIAYGRPGASEVEIEEAARLANAHDFISAFPEGYQTLAGERGMKLSGGERQRIALARAFLRDAPILILDEPTSAIDVATEAKIVEAIERLMKNRTTFMIAHRLSTLEACDMRLRVDEGRVVRVAAQPPTSRTMPA